MEGERVGKIKLGRRLLALPLVGAAALAIGMTATTAASGAASPIKVAVLSDCKGAFGVFDGQDLGGVVTAFAQLTGAKPKDKADPRKGMTGGTIAGHPIKLVGIGCSDDRADTAIKETKRLMEKLKADVMIGPLSGDESIAVAKYAKAHPTKTFVNGSAGALDTTMIVRAPNFFRFTGDGAQWNAGLGSIAYNKLKWKKAAVIMDDYSFGWTSGAGFIAEFCGVGGDVVKRVFPPLNTTDYSSFAAQLPAPDQVDGYFWAVGGAGTLPSLQAFEQKYGPIKNSSQFMGNLFWGTPGTFQELGTRLSGSYVGGAGTAGDLKTPLATAYANTVGKYFTAFPPLKGDAKSQASSTFTAGFYVNTVGLIQALKAVKGDISGGQKKLQAALSKTVIKGPYGTIHLDKNRQGIIDAYSLQLYTGTDGKLAIKTTNVVKGVTQDFGGSFSPSLPPPGETTPTCAKRTIPWANSVKDVVDGVVQ